MGFLSGSLAEPEDGGGDGDDVERIWMDDVTCTGEEASLSDCTFSGWGQENCKHREDVQIMCEGINLSCLAAEENTIQLVDLDGRSGRIEACHEGAWGKYIYLCSFGIL